MTIKNKTSDDFYTGLYQLADKRQFPLRILFELTYACNFSCIHCYNVVEEKKRELNTAQVKEVLNQLQKSGSFHIGFTGGEPLIRKDIFEILDYAKSLGFCITILTNGYLINSRTADKIASLGTNMNKVDISFLGADKDTFEPITRKKGSFAKVKTAVQLLRKRGVDVMVKFTLMKQNKKQIKRIKAMAHDWGCMFKYSPTLNAKTDGSKSPLEYRLSPQDAMKVAESLEKNRQQRPRQKILSQGPPGKEVFFRCGAGKTEASINPYGELKLCPEINRPAYSILDLGLNRTWDRLKKYVDKLEKSDYVCKRCYLANFCNSCPARMFAEEGTMDKCNQYDKEMAVLQAEKYRLKALKI